MTKKARNFGRRMAPPAAATAVPRQKPAAAPVAAVVDRAATDVGGLSPDHSLWLLAVQRRSWCRLPSRRG